MVSRVSFGVRTLTACRAAPCAIAVNTASVDPMAVLFGLEEEFSVLDVQRIDPTPVKMIIEQTASEGLCPAHGMLTAALKERPLRRLETCLPAGRPSSCGGARAAA